MEVDDALYTLYSIQSSTSCALFELIVRETQNPMTHRQRDGMNFQLNMNKDKENDLAFCSDVTQLRTSYYDLTDVIEFVT